jgi:NAD(P)-dependent dehydrogenase (short-subunit alcohol dehydrogenase family)
MEETTMKRLQDRVALVTGSAAGVGRAIAEALLNEGAKVALNDVNETLLKGTEAELKGQNLPVHAIMADISKGEEVFAMKDEIIKHFGRIDILVNNAGGALNAPSKLNEIEERHWNLVIDVNLKGAFFCCQAIIPEMARQGGGAIVNISALAAHWRASLAGVQYTAAKAGVEGLTRQLAYDWGKAGIRVNAVAPTVTMSGDRVQSLWEGKGEEEKQRVLSAIPLGRLGTLEEIASVVVFLASDESSYITGITIDVSGGRYLR